MNKRTLERGAGIILLKIRESGVPKSEGSLINKRLRALEKQK